MLSGLRAHIVAAFAPPQYLSPPRAGFDLSASGVKGARAGYTSQGLVLERYADVPLPPEAFTNGGIIDRGSVVKALKETARALNVRAARVALPEAKSYLFETAVTGITKEQWRLEIEQHLEEFVPLPPQATIFDVVPTKHVTKGKTSVVGVAFARRVVEDTLAVFEEAGIVVENIEPENFALARAVLPARDTSTALLIDIGKTTTKITIVSAQLPHFTTTVNIGGHALTLAIQKYFGVTEDEARRVKLEQGIVPAPGNEEFLGAMLSTVSAIRDELVGRLEYWQTKVAAGGPHEAVSRAILVGGNATVRGLPEYLANALKIPVTTGDVFTNFVPRDLWLPQLEYNESLAYATAIGLALQDAAS